MNARNPDFWRRILTSVIKYVFTLSKMFFLNKKSFTSETITPKIPPPFYSERGNEFGRSR